MPSTGREPSWRLDDSSLSVTQGSVYYTTRSASAGRRRANAPPRLPTPPIRPRQRRPHSIHILAYPPGYVPSDLRQKSSSATKKSRSRFSRDKADKRKSLLSLPPIAEIPKGKFGKFLSVFSIAPKSISETPSDPTTSARPVPSRATSSSSSTRNLTLSDPAFPAAEELRSRPTSMVDTFRPAALAFNANGHRNSIMSIRPSKLSTSSSVVEVPKPVASGSGVSCSILLAEPTVFLTGFDHDGHARREGQHSSALLRGNLQLSVSKNVKIKSVTLKLVGKARTEWPEGIPPMKTDMFEEENLRTQSLVFFHAMHEGIWETDYGNQCNYKLKSAAGNNGLMSSASANQSNSSINPQTRPRPAATLTAKELKRLSLQSANSRSFGKGDSPLTNQVQAKGYKIFHPGTYEYSFELPIDHHQLETAKLQYGSVKWVLETSVERAGAFKPNLHGTKEVCIVRVPDQMSLEMSEPISISRQWEDQLHYDIMISGKSFPIGSKIPIAFKLTPLAKVQVHKLKVFLTESIEYWTNDRRVTRKDPGRKILLMEKSAGKPLDKQYEGSDIRVLSGGELAPSERAEARRVAATRRSVEASRARRAPAPLPEPTENLLGDLELGLEHYWGSTELEMNVQIPTCETMAKDKTLRLHPDCSWRNVNVYHWIKIVMRISRIDPEDPTSKRRRHFEISIDSPCTILNCRATQANTALPQYCGADGGAGSPQTSASCGCPDANVYNASPSSSTGHLALVEHDSMMSAGSHPSLDRVNSSMLPAAPQSAHLNASPVWPDVTGARSSSPQVPHRHPNDHQARPSSSRGISPSQQPRPIHLLRVPSYNPPAFDADAPPVPYDIVTPPPNYDVIIGTPSVDGMADYFARLSAYECEESDEGTIDSVIASSSVGRRRRDSDATLNDTDTIGPSSHEVEPEPEAGDFFSQPTGGVHHGEDTDSDEGDHPVRAHQRGRVNVANPRTPGGRTIPSRSLEIERPAVPLSMEGVVRRGE